ncbi:hypothetical protein MIR68_010014 [Amoeboaphelidium protococcarum]|nr:hypothetical protein MIR68_010014 [Amoeboaphelidium protococcarum]
MIDLHSVDALPAAESGSGSAPSVYLYKRDPQSKNSGGGASPKPAQKPAEKKPAQKPERKAAPANPPSPAKTAPAPPKQPSPPAPVKPARNNGAGASSSKTAPQNTMPQDAASQQSRDESAMRRPMNPSGQSYQQPYAQFDTDANPFQSFFGGMPFFGGGNGGFTPSFGGWGGTPPAPAPQAPQQQPQTPQRGGQPQQQPQVPAEQGNSANGGNQQPQPPAQKQQSGQQQNYQPKQFDPNAQVNDASPGTPEREYMDRVRNGEGNMQFDPATKQWTDQEGRKFQEVNNQLFAMPPSGNSNGGPGSAPGSQSSPSNGASGQSGQPGAPSGSTPGTPPGAPGSNPPPPTDQSPPPPKGPSSPGQYNLAQPGSKSASQAGRGGIMNMNNYQAAKSGAQRGINSEIQDPEQRRYANALYLGAVGTETGGGQNMPNDADQAQRGKLGNDMEEIGPARIGRGLWKRMGYSEEEIQRIKADGNGAYANEQSARVFAKGPQELGGMRNFMAYQRGGVTMYNKATDYRDAPQDRDKYGPMTQQEQKDLDHLTENYRETQQEVINNPDLLDPSNNQVPWLNQAAPEI